MAGRAMEEPALMKIAGLVLCAYWIVRAQKTQFQRATYKIGDAPPYLYQAA